jgi:predicted nucleotidyltransferase
MGIHGFGGRVRSQAKIPVEQGACIKVYVVMGKKTKDIDILIRLESLDAAKAALADIEYDLESGLFRFNPNTDQESQMYRVSRAESNNLVTLDLMLVAPVFEPVWNDREAVSLGEIVIKVVSKKGQITIKNVAGRPQDNADIDALRRLDDE